MFGLAQRLQQGLKAIVEGTAMMSPRGTATSPAYFVAKWRCAEHLALGMVRSPTLAAPSLRSIASSISSRSVAFAVVAEEHRPEAAPELRPVSGPRLRLPYIRLHLAHIGVGDADPARGRALDAFHLLASACPFRGVA